MRLNGENSKLEWFNPIKQMCDEEYTFLDNFILTKTYGDILEIGQGGSTVILLDATKDTDRKVVSIDIKFKLKNVMKYLPMSYIERFMHVQEDSHKWTTKKMFGTLLIDGEHSFTSVRKDTMNYWDNLEENGYAIFHDYKLSEDVTKFVDDWVNSYKQARKILTVNNLVILQKC